MARYAAFLRGINVGGHRVTKSELTGILEGVGCSDVATWRASGNLAFTAPDTEPESIITNLEGAFEASLGYQVPVLLRTASEIAAVAASEPFESHDGRGKHQVIFLRQPPGENGWDRFLGLVGPDELVMLAGREIHWSPSRGVLDSGLDVTAVEKLLSPTTMRTMNTIRQMVERFF